MRTGIMPSLDRNCQYDFIFNWIAENCLLIWPPFVLAHYAPEFSLVGWNIIAHADLSLNGNIWLKPIQKTKTDFANVSID